jgi:tetratricopeptide (TPR) repeat protein
VSEDIITASVPAGLREHLRSASVEPEHRIATVGFIHFGGFDEMLETEGGTAAAGALDALLTSVQSATDEEGVTFLATDIDEDGGKIVLVSGVPAAQHDDEGRMLRAVRRIVDASNQLLLNVGVNRGHVFAGEVGAQYRSTYTVMGDTVNLAARLMAAAPPGSIYSGSAVLDVSRTLYSTTALEPLLLRGKSEPVQAYAVGAETGTRSHDEDAQLPFVGRHKELSRLHPAMAQLAGGRGGVISILGETGIGKTRLVAEALSSVEPAQTLTVRAEPYGSNSPYRPLRDAFRDALGVKPAGPMEMAGQLLAIAKDLDTKLVPFLPLIGDVVHLEVPETDEVKQIEPRFRRDRVADIVVRWLELASPGSLVIVAEDAHWMDEASSHLLDRLVAETEARPWLVVVTRRVDGGGFETDRGEALHLNPLSEAEAAELVIAATEAAPLRPHEVNSIVKRAGGNPLFLGEIVIAVREVGGVGGLPETLDAVVSAQIDALPPLPRRILRYASVLGRSFRTDLIDELLVAEQISLDSATREQLSRFVEPEGKARLRFRHAMFRDVAYEGLSYRRRRELHLRAGNVLERLAAPNAEDAADQLSLHYSLAEEHRSAWRFARIAGDRARDVYANVEAAEHYERALEAARALSGVETAELAEVWTQLGDVREAAGLFAASLEAYRRASQLVKGDPVSRARALYKIARARERSGAYSLALRELTIAQRLLEGSRSASAHSVRAQLLATRAQVHQAQEQPRDALRVAEEAVVEAQSSENLEALASAYVRLDWANLFLGNPDKAIHGEKALAIYEELGDVGSQAIVIGTTGIAAYFDGRWDDALELYEQGRDTFLRAGNAVHAAHADSNIGEVLVNQGRLEEAEPILRGSIRVLRASGFPDGAAFGETQLGRTLTGLGRFDEAEDVLRDAWEEAKQLGIPSMSADAAVYLAESQLRSKRPDLAMRTLDVVAEGAGGDFIWQSATLARVRAEVLADLGRVPEAIEELDLGLVAARDHGLAYEEALLMLLLDELTDDPDPENRARATALLDGLGVRRVALAG